MVDLSVALNDRVTISGARTLRATSRARRNSPTPLWPFSRTMRGPIWRRRRSSSTNSNGQRQYRRLRPRLRTTPTMRPRMRSLSFWNMFLGHSEDGFAGIETALRLSPRDPDVSGGSSSCATPTPISPSGSRRSNGAASRSRAATSMFPFVDLAAANAWAGHDKEAKEAVAQLRKLYPASPSRLGRASTGATIRPSTRNISGSSRACARRACPRARRKRTDDALPCGHRRGAVAEVVAAPEAPEPFTEIVQVDEDDRCRVQRQHLTDDEPADDGDAQRVAQFRAFAGSERKRQSAEQRGESRHHDRAKA